MVATEDELILGFSLNPRARSGGCPQHLPANTTCRCHAAAVLMRPTTTKQWACLSIVPDPQRCARARLRVAVCTAPGLTQHLLAGHTEICCSSVWKVRSAKGLHPKMSSIHVVQRTCMAIYAQACSAGIVEQQEPCWAPMSQGTILQPAAAALRTQLSLAPTSQMLFDSCAASTGAVRSDLSAVTACAQTLTCMRLQAAGARVTGARGA